MANPPSAHHEKILLCFTDLPPSVRRRIYIMAGLVRVCPISLNTEGLSKAEYLEECREWCLEVSPPAFDLNAQASWRCFYRRKRFMKQTINVSPEGFDCVCIPLPCGLLRVSRAIHDEVSSILYSENKFRICRSDHGGLSSLFTLSPAALQFMTSLSIGLNACSCVPDHLCPDQWSLEKQCPECHDSCRLGRDLPISVKQSDSRLFISEWKQFLRQLAAHLYPAQLRLSVVCDTLDYATAKEITEPLLQLPQLAECSIRLGQAQDSALHFLAQATVYQLTGQPSHHLNKPFNFSALPEEIQVTILGHTDLVSPVDIGWTNGAGLELPSCCMRCTDALEACCCAVLHAAYSSKSCDCWVMPSAIFLVSKKVHEYATEIFFSQNTFKIYPGDFSPDSLHLLEFLRAIPSAAWQHLRAVQVELRGLEYRLLGSGTEYQNNWDLTIGFISQSLDLPRLCLRIEDAGSRGASEANLTTGSDDSAEVEEQEWMLYQHLGEPLSKLKGIKDLWIHFAPAPYRKFAELRKQREIILEKRIMGDAYDSTDRGKFMERDQRRAKEKEANANPIFGPDEAQIWPIR